MMRATPEEVRHDWRLHKTHTIAGQTVANVYVCQACDAWTANLPLYRNEICQRKDRRRKNQDRRKSNTESFYYG